MPAYSSNRRAPFTPCVNLGSTLLNDMAMWFINEVKIVPKAAEKYATRLYDREVGSIARLKKKLTKNENFLAELNFAEDDVDDIIAALFPKADSSELFLRERLLTNLNTIPTVPNRNYDISAAFCGHSGGIWSVIELADGTICSGSADHSIRIWNVGTLACVKILGGHTNSVGTYLPISVLHPRALHNHYGLQLT